MAAAGMDLLVDVTKAAVVGPSESLGRVPVLYRAYRKLRAALEGTPRPGVVVLIDFPEFNLRLARAARRARIPVVYFIPPQIWAWRGGRIRTIRRLVSLVLAVLPFEPPLYRRAGVPVEFVGHPLIDVLAAAPSRGAARERLGLSNGAEVLALLPGSRREEVDRMLPIMRDTLSRVAAQRPATRFVLALAPTIEQRAVERHLAGGPPVTVIPHEAYAVMRAADAALVTSGTATLESALLGTPMVVCYRLSRVSALVMRALIRVPWASLANLVLGRAVVPELHMAAATGERLAAEALRLLGDPAVSAAQRAAFRELADELGEPGVSARAARFVLAEQGAHR